MKLVVIYLGGVVKCVHMGEIVPVTPVTIRKTGAVHRARFMAYSLYHLKISVYQRQIVTDRQNIINANILAEYVALIYTQYFFKVITRNKCFATTSVYLASSGGLKRLPDNVRYDTR